MSTPPMTERPPKGGAGTIKASAAARLLPPPRYGGAIPWVIAILMALVVIAAAGGLSLRNLAQNARADLSDAVTIQIIEANPMKRAEQADQAADVLTSLSNVTAVRIVPEAELEALLEPWLGAGAESDEIPIPALIDVELSGTVSAAQIEQMQTALAQTLPNARVDAQSDWLKPVYEALSALQWLALALIILVAFATAAAVWLAARNAFTNHRETVEILHLLGGTDRQVTNIFQRTFLREAAFGSVIGLAMGASAVWLLGQQFSGLDSGMIGGGGLRWQDWAIVATIPFAGVLLALVTGRITISMALRKML
jgi:cell division transport system permease protein